MVTRRQTFEALLKGEHPRSTPGFQELLKEAAGGCDPKILEDFFLCLNDLLSTLWMERGKKAALAKEMLLALLEENPQLTLQTLQDMIEEMRLDYRDPLVEVVCQASSAAPRLLSFLGEVVQRESQLLRLRIRALEALFMRISQEEAPRWLGSEAEGVLRFLNQVLFSLEQGSMGSVKNLYTGLAGKLRSIQRLIASTEAQERTDKKDSAAAEYRRILQLTQKALRQLALRPATSESIHFILGVLRESTPLPAWHPASSFLLGLEPGASKGDALSQREDPRTSLALIIDKTIEIVLFLAAISWSDTILKAGREEGPLGSPSNQALLEAVLLDQKYSPKMRSIAAALLFIQDYARPVFSLSPRVEFFARLFLLPHHAVAPGRGKDISVADAEEKIPFLLEALDEKSDFVRWQASQACARAAQDHPEWFQPGHYPKLLTLLSDDHPGVRLNVIRAFGALASFRDQEIVSVIQNISASLAEKAFGGEIEGNARRDLEIALGVGLRHLVERVDELQAEIHGLAERSKKWVEYVEKQTMRVGEEIHHEILNTLCGYLATAIDEEAYGEAKRRLDDLIRELRRIMNNLYPRDLEAEGFLATIRKRLEDAKAQSQKWTPGFRVEFDRSAEITDAEVAAVLTDASHLVLLYRIVLEAIINARKHARGTFIRVQICRPQADVLEISVSDDGHGNGGPFEGNAGIPLMLRRAQEIGAGVEFKKTSSLGGTAVVIRLTKSRSLRSWPDSRPKGGDPYPKRPSVQ